MDLIKRYRKASKKRKQEPIDLAYRPDPQRVDLSRENLRLLDRLKTINPTFRPLTSRPKTPDSLNEGTRRKEIQRIYQAN